MINGWRRIKWHAITIFTFIAVINIGWKGLLIVKKLNTIIEKDSQTPIFGTVDNLKLIPDSLFEVVLDLNSEQKVRNIKKFGPHTADSVVFVIQIKDDNEYFYWLLQSLRKVRDIDKVTLVISKSYFSNVEANAIDFCRYMTIIFPFSMQLFPKSFPGEDKNDCPRNILIRNAVKKKCNNALFPDRYGHYREVKYVQSKHRWLWQLHMLFKGTDIFLKQTAPMILLEENNYVLPDVLNCTWQAIELKNKRCKQCGFISLGSYNAPDEYKSKSPVEVSAWASSKSTVGLVITRELYNNFSTVLDYACEYDDYNWSWSIQSAFAKKLTDKIFALHFVNTRVFRLSNCDGKCSIEEEIKNIEEQIKKAHLFPTSLDLISVNKMPLRGIPPNGGWSDKRDHALCKKYKDVCGIVAKPCLQL